MALLGFPNPVNEIAARTVAAGVVLLTGFMFILATALDTVWLWLTIPLAYGFLARVLTGPRLSPLGQVATRVIAPRVGREKLVAGPPKRFAQAMGLAMSTAALVLHAAGWDRAALVFVGMVFVAATLESAFALCLGCKIFAVLMRLGVIPEDTCRECNDISLRYSTAS